MKTKPGKTRSKYSKSRPNQIWLVPEAYATGLTKLILSHALQLFIQKGFGNVSISQIAESMGESKQRLLYYYKSSDEILIDLAKVWGQIGTEFTSQYMAEDMSYSPSDKVLSMARATFLLLEKYPSIMRLFPILSQAASYNPAAESIFQSAMSGGILRLKNILAHMPELKGVKEKDLNQHAQGLHFIMLGAVYYSLSTRSLLDNNRFQDEVIFIVRSYLDQLLASFRRS